MKLKYKKRTPRYNCPLCRNIQMQDVAEHYYVLHEEDMTKFQFLKLFVDIDEAPYCEVCGEYLDIDLSTMSFIQHDCEAFIIDGVMYKKICPICGHSLPRKPLKHLYEAHPNSISDAEFLANYYRINLPTCPICNKACAINYDHLEFKRTCGNLSCVGKLRWAEHPEMRIESSRRYYKALEDPESYEGQIYRKFLLYTFDRKNYMKTVKGINQKIDSIPKTQIEYLSQLPTPKKVVKEVAKHAAKKIKTIKCSTWRIIHNQLASGIQIAVYGWICRLFPNYTVEINYWVGKYNVDIVILELRLVIEIDGKRWHNDANKDLRRDEFLHRLGFKIRRIDADLARDEMSDSDWISLIEIESKIEVPYWQRLPKSEWDNWKLNIHKTGYPLLYEDKNAERRVYS